MADGTYAVIPVKPFTSAKRRLDPILNHHERMRLARLMLMDVLDSLGAARRVARSFVITCDDDVACQARRGGADIIREEGEFGLDHAVSTAIAALAGHCGGIAVIPADIPHVSPAVIDDVIGITCDGGVTIVPATCDGGTNLLCMRPPGLMAPSFGPNSFERHHHAAIQAGAVTRVHICPRTGHDIDRPSDLETFLGFASRTRTHDFIAGLSLRERRRQASRSSFTADLARAPL